MPSNAIDRRWVVVWCVGALLLMVGTFLPWLHSGRIAKNSYQLADVGLRRIALPSWLDAFLSAWPFLGPIWAVMVVLLLLGHRRTGAAASLAVALVTIVVAVAGIVMAARLDSAYLSGALPGPAVTAVGAGLVLVAGVALLRGGPRSAS